MFMLVSSRYERASLIVTSNKPFSAWGGVFGDEIVAAAMIDRLVHHAEIVSLKGDSCTGARAEAFARSAAAWGTRATPCASASPPPLASRVPRRRRPSRSRRREMIVVAIAVVLVGTLPFWLLGLALRLVRLRRRPRRGTGRRNAHG